MNKTIVICAARQDKSVDYVEAMKHTAIDGERVLVVTPSDGRDDLRQLGASSAGLILCGGPDVEPWRYGEESREDAKLDLVPELDATEWLLLEGAQAAKTPIWAICRGLQTLNVFLGGTLWQDLPTQLPNVENHDVAQPLDHLAHTVEVHRSEEKESEFAELLASKVTKVNTRHHQAIQDVAPDLRAIASSPDGVIEVAESRTDWWLRAVQWHPEDLIAHAIQRKLWRDFIQAALDKAAGRARVIASPS